MIGRFVQRKTSQACLAAAVTLTLAATQSARADFFNGFETNIDSWITPTRVASGTNGITSRTGAWHAEAGADFTRWGGYGMIPSCSGNACAASFPTYGYTTSIDIYLDVGGGWATNTRFDFSSAINEPSGAYRRDFIFNGGFYTAGDATLPGAGQNRFIISPGNNSQPGSAFPSDPGHSPIAITATGWYTFTHRFYNDGGVLACQMTVRNSSGVILNPTSGLASVPWTRRDVSDLIATVVGGNRYGWFDFNEFPFLAIDNSTLTVHTAPTLELVPDDSCYQLNDTVVVEVNVSGLQSRAAGGQFFLNFDNTKLQFLSAVPGDPGTAPPSGPPVDPNNPFEVEVYECVGETVGGVCMPFPGRLDYAVGVSGGGVGSGSDDDNTMAVLRFMAIGEICSSADLVQFRDTVSGPLTPPTRLTDEAGSPMLPTLLNLDEITIDSIAPDITCPPNITVNADAGECTADVDIYASTVQTFDVNPTLSPTQAPGVWYTDRYAPFGFASAVFAGGNRLKHSINAADCETCRPPAYQFPFYNTQGRKFDTPGSVAMSIDLYVPAAWAATGRRMAGFWGTGLDALNVLASFPIIEFTSNTDTDGSGPRFRSYNSDTGVWTSLGLPTGFAYDSWYTIHMALDGSDFVFTVGDVTSTEPALGAVQIGNVILQGHNTLAGVTYDIYWDNFAFSTAPSASDNCTVVPIIVGQRSDFLPLDALYPTGVTTITWTATDCAGNVDTCNQLITVNPYNEMDVTVQLSPNIDTGSSFPQTLTRCITFEFWECPDTAPVATVDAEITFTITDGVLPLDPNVAIGTGTVLVPCGTYTCITARDKRHTLRRTDEGFGIVGTKYLADFTGATPAGDWLIGGNLNDDNVIDILDFGVFVSQYLANYGTGDTTCATPHPHADISGDGIVFTQDYTFIANNFLKFHEANCCGQPFAAATVGNPSNPGARIARTEAITRISVEELRKRGLDDLVVADLNHDGWLDTADMQAFMSGGAP